MSDEGAALQDTSFLYPFIEAEERDTSALLRDLSASARAKIEESSALTESALRACAQTLRAAGSAMARHFESGARLFAFGNGGSATDADSAVDLFRSPPKARPLPAISLVEDSAVITALANDIGFENVFARQLIAHSKPGDIAMGFSTSGNSPNLNRAFEMAAARELLKIGFAGYDGGSMLAAVDHCLVVRSDSVHRIQEAQSALTYALWEVVQEELDQTAYELRR